MSAGWEVMKRIRATPGNAATRRMSSARSWTTPSASSPR